VGNNLVISNVASTDAGNYVCKCKTEIEDLPPVATAPPRSTGWIREPQLTLSEQSSNLPAGEGTTIECYSSDDSYPNVMWERADGAPFSDNVRVSTVGNIPL